MKIKIKDFRCFHETPEVELRPITLLVGENSAGKTSFLAALRFALEFVNRGIEPSFNRDPFFLGSFDSIAHFRGGKFGRAKSFSFEISDEIPPGRLRGTAAQENFLPFAKPGQQSYKLKIEFGNYNSQPTLSQVHFGFGGYHADLKLSEEGEEAIFVLKTPSEPEFQVPEKFTSGWRGGPAEFAFFDYLVGGLPFNILRGATNERDQQIVGTPRFIDELRNISDVFRRVTSARRTSVYATAPVRTRPERNYNLADYQLSADGGHIPFVLAQLQSFHMSRWEKIAEALGKFGKSSGLFEKLEVKQIGSVGSGPFQLIVHFPRRKSNIIDVGYGVSQALPIVADTLRMSNTTFLVQQPEVHLHPRAQAELGTFFSEVSKQRKHTLLIETHSDYLIDRIRMEAREGKTITPQEVSILYFERDGHEVYIHQLDLDDLGNVRNAPPNYRDFFLREEMRSLGLVDE